MAKQNQPVDAVPGLDMPECGWGDDPEPVEKLHKVREHLRARRHMLEQLKNPHTERFDAGCKKIIGEVLGIIGDE